MKKSPPSFLKISLLAGWLLLGLSLLGIGLYTFLTPYEQFTTVLLQAVHKLDWRTYFQQAVFPLAQYQLLPYLLGGAFLGWLLLTPWFFQKANAWAIAMQWFFKESVQQQMVFWRQRSQSELFFLMLIMGLAFLRMLYYLGHYALQYDEAWTYNHFISNGLLVSAISPNNNHIFYTLWACLTDLLPIAGQYSLRIPVVMGGLLLLLVFYKLAREYSSAPWALLGLSFLAFAPAASLYSLYARGYIFQMLFTVLALSATLKIVEQHKVTYHWAWWSIAHVLGLYSVPTHAYVVVLMSGFLLWKSEVGLLSSFFLARWRAVSHLQDGRQLHTQLELNSLESKGNKGFLITWLKANVAVLGSTIVLYAPYLVTNGGAILWAAASQGSSGEALWNYQDKVADWLLWGGGRGTPVYGVWLGLIGFLGLYRASLQLSPTEQPTMKPLVELILLFLLFPTLLNGLLGSQPPYRVWCFLGPFLALWIVVVGQALAPHWKLQPKALLLVVLIIITTYIWRLEKHYALQWSAQLDWQVKAIAEQLLEADIQSCYLFSNYDKPLLEYYYLRAGKRLQTWMAAPNSKDFAPFEQEPLYEAVLWDKEDREPSPEEQAWLEQHYPVVIYQDARVQLHLPSPVSASPAN